MAESTPFTAVQERYSALETAYRQQQWGLVINRGEALLDELAGLTDSTSMGLRQRVELLLGHTFLHGLGDRDSAEDHYSALLQERTEPALRQAAEEGLRACNRPRQALSPHSADHGGADGATAGAAAMGGTTAAPATRAAARVQAGSGEGGAGSAASGEGRRDLAAVTSGSTQAAMGSQGENGVTTPGEGSPAGTTTPPRHEDPSRQPQPAAGGAPGAATPWLTAITGAGDNAAPTGSEPTGSAPTALAPTAARPADLPSVAGETTASKQPQRWGEAAAAVPWLPAATQPPLRSSEGGDVDQPPGAGDAKPAANLSLSKAEAPAAGLSAPRLEVELVEEPDQLEVHQADPRLAEELLLQELTHAADGQVRDSGWAHPNDTRAEPVPPAEGEEDPELLAGLLRVRLG